MHNVFYSFSFSVLEHHFSDAALDQPHWGPCRCRGVGGLGQGQAAISQGLGTTWSCCVRQKESPGKRQQWPVGAAAAPAPGELSAVLCFHSLQPCSGQADFLPLWSCWSPALLHSHPCSLSLLCGGGTKPRLVLCHLRKQRTET